MIVGRAGAGRAGSTDYALFVKLEYKTTGCSPIIGTWFSTRLNFSDEASWQVSRNFGRSRGWRGMDFELSRCTQSSTKILCMTETSLHLSAGWRVIRQPSIVLGSVRIRNTPTVLLLVLTALLASCCEPGHRNSLPASVDSAFQETYAYDLDVYNTQVTGVTDSGYHPIYTFGVKNTGTEDDDFRLNIVMPNGAEIDIIKHVKAGAVQLFQTPTSPLDSSARYIIPFYTAPADTSLPLARDYYGFFSPTPDLTEIHLARPTVTVAYGEINSGPEACNTPASVQSLNIDRLPRR